MKKYIKSFLILISVFLSWSCIVNASIEFSSKSSSIALKPGTQVTYNSAFSGWDSHSVVKDSGNDNLVKYGTLPNLQYADVPYDSLVILGKILGNTTVLGRSFLNSPIDLQGGTLNLFGDLSLSSQTTIVSSGFFHLNSNAMVLGGDLTIPTDVKLTVTSSGVIDGQGNLLIFEGNGKLLVDQNVTLTLRNVVLKDIKDFGIDESSLGSNKTWRSRLALQNSEIKLSRNYTFTIGELYIHGDVVVSGTNQFAYTSTNQAWITDNSTLKFDVGTTFSYGSFATMAYGSPKTLLGMTDATSQLYFNGCHFVTTCTGIQLTKGTLIIDHKNLFYNQDGLIDNDQRVGLSVSEAIAFGDGTAANDLNIEIMPAGNFELTTGILAYNNQN